MASKMEVLFQYVTFNFPAIAMNFSNEWLSCIPLFIGLNGWMLPAPISTIIGNITTMAKS